MQYKIIVALLFAGVIVGSFIGLSFKSDTIVYHNEIKQRHEIIAEKTLAIYESDEFKAEMLALATARALFAMSLDEQDGAVELSEMAMMSYEKSQLMADTWHSNQ